MINQEKLILLVEDNKDDEELTIRALKQNQISNKVVVVNDGVEAIDYLNGQGRYKSRSLQDLPQLILLDLKLPKMNGLDVLKQIRSNVMTQLIPVVIMTSSNEEEDIVSSYRFGANSYIRKSVEFKKFNQSIQHLSVYWLLINQAPPQYFI
jgi:two-component system, response regulator